MFFNSKRYRNPCPGMMSPGKGSCGIHKCKGLVSHERQTSLLSLSNRGFRKPKHPILGGDIAGRVEAIGKDVTQFQPGDEVFGGVQVGSFAEYVAARESRLLLKPPTVSFEAASSIRIAGVTALQAVRDNGHVQTGQKVLINGASGGVGTFAVQIDKVFGAEVTGVCSTEKLEMLRSIGADHVVDYKRDDFTKRGETYDVIFDVIGRSPFSRSVRSLTPNGRYLINNARMSQVIRGPRVSRKSSKQVITWIDRKANEYADSLGFLRTLLEAGTIKPVIDRCYPLEQIVEAHRYVDAGHKKGSVVITVGHYDDSSPTAHRRTTDD